ncbi:MAG: RHS repeat-associated core domain-containing protein [Eubacteriales bacterium]
MNAVYNESGVKVYSYSYDAWGNVLITRNSATGTNGYAVYNPFLYRGYYYDTELGLYYLNSRYYDPNTGRFINADGQLNGGLLGYNLFAYCENNPVNYYDPTGNMATEAAITLTNWWNPFGWIAAAILVVEVVVIVVAVAVVCDTIEDTASTIKASVEKKKNTEDIHDQSVYILTDPNDGDKVKYVGRTNDPARRRSEHDRHPIKSNYEMTVVATGLNIQEAKLMEQSLISAYTLDYLDNARREIAVGNLSAYESYIDAVIQIYGSVSEDELKNLMGR